MPKRSYKQMSGSRSKRIYPRKQRWGSNRGLRPSYRGWAPRQFTRGEWKYLDTAVAATAINTAGTMNLLNGIAPGTGASQRIGMKIAIRSIEMRLAITSVAECPSQFNRLMLLLDRQCNGAAPAALTDFIIPGTYMGCRCLTNRKRFKIMWDKTFVHGCTTVNYTAGNPKTFRHIYMKLKRPIIVEYNAGVAGTVADIASNSLYIISVGDVAAGATDSDFSALIRLRYTDM